MRVARDWLMQMGEAARKNGLTIQYCMSYPRHILQSLEIPVVTHVSKQHALDSVTPHDPHVNQWRHQRFILGGGGGGKGGPGRN